MKTKKSLVSFLLLCVFLCQFIIPTIVRADIGYTDNTSGRFPTDYSEIDAIIRNYRNQPIEYDEAFVSKTASKGEKDGEFYIDLKIQGKEKSEPKMKDIVIVLDNSNSMKLNGTKWSPEDNKFVLSDKASDGAHDRVTAANNAIKTFLDNVKEKAGENVRFALVTYGSDVFDGSLCKEFYFENQYFPDNTVGTLTPNKEDIIAKLPTKAPYELGKSCGATFTQAALKRAADILKSSPNGNEKYIIHLTDGTPTRSYKMKSVDRSGIATFDYSNTITSERNNYYYELYRRNQYANIMGSKMGDGQAYELVPKGDARYNQVYSIHRAYDVPDASTGRRLDITNHGRPTLYEAKNIVNKYQTFTVGVELSGYTFNNDGYSVRYPAPHHIDKPYAVDIMERMSTSKNHYYDATNIDQLSTLLSKIEARLFNPTVVNGSVSDPMGDMVDLNLNANLDGNKFYKLSASSPSLLNGVEVRYDSTSRKISMTGLNLGANQWVNLRYKVNLRTEDPQYKGNFFYPTNGPTTLTPNSKNPNTKRDFPVPSVKANTIDVNVQKLWKYKNGTELPDSMKKEIKVKLVRKSTNPNVAAADREKEIAEKTLNKAGNWTGTFEKLIPFDNLGYHFEYTVKEVTLEGFESKIEYSNNKNFIKSESADVKITNTKNIEVEFFKYKTENDQKIALPDVEFELYKQDITERYLPVQKNGKNVVVKSGADGKFKFDNLEVGKYAIKEIKAPEGYRLPKDFVREFEVTNQGKIKYRESIYGSDEVFYQIQNFKLNPMYFMFSKQDSLGELIKQGTLVLELKGPKEKTQSYDLITSTENGFKFDIPDDFPTGDYVLTEKTAPMGYAKTNIEYHIRIDAEDRTITLVKEVKGRVETPRNIVLYKDIYGNVQTQKIDIKNDKVTYPYTGGTGTLIFIVSGLFVMLCAGSVYMLKKKKSLNN